MDYRQARGEALAGEAADRAAKARREDAADRELQRKLAEDDLAIYAGEAAYYAKH